MDEVELVTLPHFKVEEVAALKIEHERRVAAMKIRPALDPDEERVRDAIQREAFWRAQPESEHQQEELAHCLFIQGKLDEALELANDPERIGYYQSVGFAILRDDDETCECESEEHVVGRFASAKHGGKLVDIRVCPECKAVNIG